MHCAACSTAIQKALVRLPGVVAADVSLLTESANVEYETGLESVVSVAKLVQEIEDCGFEAEVSTLRLGCEFRLKPGQTLAIIHIWSGCTMRQCICRIEWLPDMHWPFPVGFLRLLCNIQVQ
jgi:copper chaperone CopZ